MVSQRSVSARRARTADAAACIHLALLALAKLIMGAIGLAFSVMYSSPPALLGSVIADVLALILLAVLLNGYRHPRLRMRIARQVGVLVLLALVEAGTAVPVIVLRSSRMFNVHPLIAILGWILAALFLALAAFNVLYTRRTGRSWREPFAADDSVPQSKSEARDHRARVAQVLLYIYLGAYIVSALAIVPLTRGRDIGKPGPVKGILAVLGLHLATVVVYLVARASAPRSPAAAVGTTIAATLLLTVANLAASITLLVAAARWRSANLTRFDNYDSTPAIMSLCAAGFAGVIAIFEGVYTLVHRGRPGLKTFFAAPLDEGDMDMDPRPSDATLAKDEEVGLERK